MNLYETNNIEWTLSFLCTLILFSFQISVDNKVEDFNKNKAKDMVSL